ncbi:MAG: efflux transporter outer membrane subunit [Gammaproteobacteria bacterium]|nr:efflux transporter outer membrane subunit [Gammaproteobacteria bacterium]MBQ0840028.1 efflux transporter outer membrane subunit [Gammaproteobacteria bacterium]
MRSSAILPTARVVVLLVALVQMSCTLGPDYQRPVTLAEDDSATAAATYRGAASQNLSTAPATPLDWWRAYNDPLLDQWVGHLLAENLDLRSAAERVVQARERAVIVGGERWPAIGLGLDGGRSFAPDFIQPSERSYRTDINVGLGISWQADLFGKVRRSVEAAEYQSLANAADYQALQQTLVAELVQLRASVAVSQRELAVQTDIVDSRQRTLDTVQRRYQLGVKNTSALGVYTAEENVASARAQLVVLDRQLSENLLVLDTLLNQRPGTLEKVETHFPLLPLSGAVTVDIPAALLDQRPDIRGNEFRLMAANAQVGVAMADLLPDLSLSLNAGFASDQWGGLFDNNNALGALTGQITTRLFEGGRLRAQIRLRESELREQAAQYAKIVLNALAEVETALLQEHYLAAQLAHLQRGTRAARKAETLAEQRYQQGISSLLVLLEAQRRRQNSERSLLAAQRASWRARVDLHLALGGDWIKKG